MDELKRELKEKLATLGARVEKIQGHLRSPGEKDFAERATEAENDEVLERLDESELQEIASIRAALARIDAGTYGACTSCGKAIGEGRLAALPTTGVCIGCAG